MWLFGPEMHQFHDKRRKHWFVRKSFALWS